MRSLPELRALFATLASASLVVACGGATTSEVGSSSGSSGASSGSSGSSGGSSGSSGASSGGSSGSSGASSGGSSGSNPGNEAVCVAQKYEPLAGVKVNGGADYLELRDEYDSGAGMPPNPPTVVAKDGTPCATAADGNACRAALAALTSAVGWRVDDFGNAPPRHRYLVFTRGDNVDVVTDLASLTTLVAPIDNAKDAALLVTAGGKYRVNCETKPNATRNADGSYLVTVESGHTCGAGSGLDEHDITVSPAGAQTPTRTTRLKDGDPNCAIGRVPEGLVAIAPRPIDTIGAHFARVARLEAASVTAFERLADELAALGAPSSLVALARESADDERRHARDTAGIARRFGHEPLPAEIAPAPPRTLFDIALENAVEGCTRETYGALVATHQARVAEDPQIRAVMEQIAEDETRHAWFSLELDRWARTQLNAAQRFTLDRARAEAMRDLTEAVSSEDICDDVRDLAGHPARDRAMALLSGLTGALAA